MNFHPNSTILSTGGADSTVRVYLTEDWSILANLTDASDTIVYSFLNWLISIYII